MRKLRFHPSIVPRSVRQTVFLVLALGFLLLTGAQYYVTGRLFAGQLLKMESADAFERQSRPRGATDLLAEDLNSTTADAAHRDASYPFVTGHRPGYAQEKINAETYRRLRLDLLLSTLLIGAACCAAAVMALQSRLVAPIEELARGVTAIGSEGSTRRRIEEQGGTTEVVTLGKSINSMLGQIEAQANLRTDRDAAIEANRLKSEFLAIMSHEIRTPMNGVLGMCELLQRTELDARQRHLSDTLLRSARSLLGILNDILDFSKIESGKLQLESAPFSPKETLNGMIAPFIATAHSKGVELITSIDGNVPGLVIGDALRLRQVLNNLVCNAVKFTSSGAVSVNCSVEDMTLEHIFLRFTVCDTGIGISSEAQGHVFDAFAQAESHTTRKFGGTGLGLAIVRRLVELMGGRIGLHSEPGVGSRFWFTVRLQRAAAKSLPTKTDSELTTGILLAAAPIVLLAEDHAVNREVLTEMLEVFGSRVTAVENGALALSAASVGFFDIILMDCQMPVMDGQTATAKLREMERATGRRRTYIVALTADATAANKKRCQEAGVDLVATKPVSQARLRELVMLALQSPARGAAPAYKAAS